MCLGLGDRDPWGPQWEPQGRLGEEGQGDGALEDRSPPPQPQLLALALSWGADYRLLVGGGNRLL